MGTWGLVERKVRVVEVTDDSGNDFIGTEWMNGEGIDFALSDDKSVSLHFDEISAIAKIALHMGYINIS